jgi:YD repeat-containing protein
MEHKHAQRSKPTNCLSRLCEKIILASTIAILSTASGFCQDTSGMPMFSVWDNDVDVPNGHVLLKVPVRSKVGFIPFSFVLSINNGVQVSTGSIGINPDEDIELVGSMGGPWHHNSPQYCPGSRIRSTEMTGWYMTDYQGTRHYASSIDIDTNGCLTGYTSQVGVADDNSGYTIYAFANGGSYVVDKAGNTTQTAVLQDPNGNKITSSIVNGSVLYTDTLGQTALTMIINHSSADQYSWTDASGTTRTIQVNYSPFTQQTAFGCSFWPDIAPFATYFPTSISLPDGSSYTFTYETTPGHAPNVTGRIASITYPTGASVSYTYTGGNYGLTCASGYPTTPGYAVVPILTRTTPDGTWTYTNTMGSTSQGIYTVTKIDPSGNETDYTFSKYTASAPPFGTQVLAYQGNGGSKTLLQTTVTCYNGNTSNCASSYVTGSNSDITQTDVFLTPGGMSQSSRVTTTYDSNSNVTDVKKYDFGASTPTVEVATPVGSWNGSACVAVGSSVNNRTCYRNIYSGSGAPQFSETFTYDSHGNLTTHVVGTATSGIGGPTLTNSATYNANGSVATSTDVNGAQTTYAYNGTGGCNNALVTSATFVPLNLTTHNQWDCNGGVMTSTTDPNGAVSSTNYVGDGADPFWRPETTTDPTSVVTTFDYSPTSMESSITFNGGSSTVDVKKFFDGLGRPYLSQKKQGPSASNWDTVQTLYSYDATGFKTATTMPCPAPSGSGCPSTPQTSQTHDALGRPLVTTDGGGGTVAYSYNKQDVLVTIGPAPGGEHTKQRQYEYDGLGRLISVCEITNAAGSGACGQANTTGLNFTTGFVTKYTYDPLNRLTQVQQNTQGSPVQTRTFAYDALGRMTSETNPETNNLAYTYVYDSDSTCGTHKGDLVKNTDANGNVICYQQDGLHRITGITYSGPNAAATPTKTFVYDGTTFSCVNGANVKGRLAEAYTGASSAKITDLAYCYSARGEVTDVYQSTPHSGGYYHTTASYWADGALASLGGPSGVPAFTTTVEGEGRVSGVNASFGPSPVVASSTYTLSAKPAYVYLGNGSATTIGSFTIPTQIA